MTHLEYPDIPYHQLLHEAARRWPDKTAIVYHERRITYAEWDLEANQVAHALLDLGVTPGDVVALFLPNCPEFEIAFFGIVRIGAIPTPLNPSYKQREVKHQLTDSEAVVAFVHESLLPTLAAVPQEIEHLREVIVVGGSRPGVGRQWDSVLHARAQRPPQVNVDAESVAALPYSSGTTGGSKGVMLNQRNLVANALQFVEATQSSVEDVILLFLPLSHIYGVALMSTAVRSGATQVLMQRFELREALRLVVLERVTELYVVPPVMLALVNAGDINPDSLHSLRFVMSAAAPLAPEVAKRLVDTLGVPLIQAYGMTEASPLTHMVPLERWEECLGTTGVVAPDTECRIMDEETGEKEMPTGEVGEVSVRGPQVMLGYWKDEADTALALRRGWLYTGDIGKVDEFGNLSIVDRKKEMIKYKAFSIAPAELEAVLLEHALVADCGVVAEPDEEAGEVPVAYVVKRAEDQIRPEVLMAWVAARVAGYKQIRAVHFVDSIPRTTSGKILRRVLKQDHGSV